MSRVWYGNLTNRLEENRQFCDEIKVGTGVTEYMYSDRHAYEVIEVKDQKHFTIREYDRKHIGEAYTNNWELISNENNVPVNVAKRGKYWYQVATANLEDLERYEKAYASGDDINFQLWWAMNGFDNEVVRTKGVQHKYHRMNISIGAADYYYDYEF